MAKKDFVHEVAQKLKIGDLVTPGWIRDTMEGIRKRGGFIAPVKFDKFDLEKFKRDYTSSTESRR